MAWVRQDEFFSDTDQALGRIQYLGRLRGVVRSAISAYFAMQPKGEKVTLAALRAIGEHDLRELAALPPGRSFSRAKQDAGLLVAQTLVEMFGRTHVSTLRRYDRISISPRRNTWADLPWVRSYAAHRVDVPQGVKPRASAPSSC